MIPRFYSASSRLLVLTRVHHDARLATSSVRRLSQRSTGGRAKLAASSHQLREAEGKVEETKFSANERVEEEELNNWLLSGREKVKESDVRPYKDPYGHFRKNVAPSFREPSPRNWLGRDVPFPLNPSFKPPIPLSDALRTQLYRAYIVDPKLNSVRALASRHNISIKRVDAILRLKGMEAAWKKDKILQTGFTKGMEHLLGVTEAKRTAQDAEDLENDNASPHSRYDVEEADLQDEVEGSNRARQRYQRLFWESVTEGEEPVMPNVLESQRGAASTRTKSRGKTTLVERAPGRPAIMFVDVGNAFVDKKERERREREGARRSKLKARSRIQDHRLHA